MHGSTYYYSLPKQWLVNTNQVIRHLLSLSSSPLSPHLVLKNSVTGQLWSDKSFERNTLRSVEKEAGGVCRLSARILHRTHYTTHGHISPSSETSCDSSQIPQRWKKMMVFFRCWGSNGFLSAQWWWCWWCSCKHPRSQEGITELPCQASV